MLERAALASRLSAASAITAYSRRDRHTPRTMSGQCTDNAPGYRASLTSSQPDDLDDADDVSASIPDTPSSGFCLEPDKTLPAFFRAILQVFQSGPGPWALSGARPSRHRDDLRAAQGGLGSLIHYVGYSIGALGASQLPIAVQAVHGTNQQGALVPGLVIHGQPTSESAATATPEAPYHRQAMPVKPLEPWPVLRGHRRQFGRHSQSWRKRWG